MAVTVKKGDTLWAIAKRLLGDGRRWKELYVNGTLAGQTDPRKLQIGATITTAAAKPAPKPAAKPAAKVPSDGGTTYKVVKGDTLNKIS